MHKWYERERIGWKDHPLWKTGDGDIHRMSDMSDSHILNALNYMEVQFFMQYTPHYCEDWDTLVGRISSVWPNFNHLEEEAYTRQNPWEVEGETVLDAYFILKRGDRE